MYSGSWKLEESPFQTGAFFNSPINNDLSIFKYFNHPFSTAFWNEPPTYIRARSITFFIGNKKSSSFSILAYNVTMITKINAITWLNQIHNIHDCHYSYPLCKGWTEVQCFSSGPHVRDGVFLEGIFIHCARCQVLFVTIIRMSFYLVAILSLIITEYFSFFYYFLLTLVHNSYKMVLNGCQ